MNLNDRDLEILAQECACSDPPTIEALLGHLDEASIDRVMIRAGEIVADRVCELLGLMDAKSSAIH